MNYSRSYSILTSGSKSRSTAIIKTVAIESHPGIDVVRARKKVTPRNALITIPFLGLINIRGVAAVPPAPNMICNETPIQEFQRSLTRERRSPEMLSSGMAFLNLSNIEAEIRAILQNRHQGRQKIRV
jgi:hypothetical protein